MPCSNITLPRYIPLNVTHQIDVAGYPFRVSRLDYSDHPISDFLDALAGSLIIFILTAITLHLISLIFGFSTNALAIRDLFDGGHLSEVYSLLFKRSEVVIDQSTGLSTRRNRIYRLFLASLLTILLFGAEGTIFILQSPTTKTFALEDMSIPKLQFQAYDGEPYLARPPNTCFTLFRSSSQLQFIDVNLCISYFETKLPYSAGDVFLMGVTQDPVNNTLEISMVADSFGRSPDFTNYVNRLDVDYTVNQEELVSNGTELSLWVTKHMANIFQCAEPALLDPPVPASFSSESSVALAVINDCKLGTYKEKFEVSKALLYSTLRPSEEKLNRSFSVNTGNETSTIDFDSFFSWQAPRYPGYVLWIVFLVLLITNLLLGSISPDIVYGKAVILKQVLALSDIPIHLREHSKFC